MEALNKSISEVENLDIHSRIVRALVGAGLIGYVLTTPIAPLGWLAVLPLLAIYPMFSAITGWDPVKAFFRSASVARRGVDLSTTSRAVFAVAGLALIGSIYGFAAAGVTPGVFAVLPIIGVYPMLAAITGIDPITALYNLDREFTEQSASDRSQVASVERFTVKPSEQGEQETHHPKAA
jgi:hypothetical protein